MEKLIATFEDYSIFKADAQCDAKATLQRFCHELAIAAVRRQACRFDFGTFNLHHIYALLVKPMLPSAHY